jgi:hypothetical protein
MQIKELVEAKIREFDRLYDQAQLVKHKLQKSMKFPEYGLVTHPVMINRLLMKRRNEIKSLQQLLV